MEEMLIYQNNTRCPPILRERERERETVIITIKYRQVILNNINRVQL